LQKAPIARSSGTASRKSEVDPSSVQAPILQPITEEIPRTTKKKVPAAAVAAEPNHKHTLPCTDEDQPPTKRRRIEPLLDETRKALLTPPSDGKSLSYAQKQYQSVWLAVPLTIDQKATCPLPKRRLSSETSTTSDTMNTQKVSVHSTTVTKRSALISVKQSPAPARNLQLEPTAKICLIQDSMVGNNNKNPFDAIWNVGMRFGTPFADALPWHKCMLYHDDRRSNALLNPSNCSTMVAWSCTPAFANRSEDDNAVAYTVSTEPCKVRKTCVM